MKSHRHIVIIALLTLTGCGTVPSGYSTASKSSETQYVRNAQGMTQYRIQDGNVFTPNGTRVARIDSSGTIWTTTGARLGKITKR